MKSQNNKKLSTTTLIGILLIVAAALFFASGIVMLVLSKNSDTGDKNESQTSSSAPQTTVPQIIASEVTQATTEEAATHTAPDHIYIEPEPQQTEPVPQAPVLIPDYMNELLQKGSESADRLESNGAQQLVTVDSRGSSAIIRFFEKNDGKWVEDETLACNGYVGSEGTIDPAEMGEDRNATPKGLYSIGDAFYKEDEPDTGLEIFQITPGTYWVNDPRSDDYNQMVQTTDILDGAEDMNAIEDYKYGFVINYNVDPVLKGKGSAIFFHCKEEDTHGCVAAPEENVLKYLNKLDAEKAPFILIV